MRRGLTLIELLVLLVIVVLAGGLLFGWYESHYGTLIEFHGKVIDKWSDVVDTEFGRERRYKIRIRVTGGGDDEYDASEVYNRITVGTTYRFKARDVYVLDVKTE